MPTRRIRCAASRTLRVTSTPPVGGTIIGVAHDLTVIIYAVRLALSSARQHPEIEHWVVAVVKKGVLLVIASPRRSDYLADIIDAVSRTIRSAECSDIIYCTGTVQEGVIRRTRSNHLSAGSRGIGDTPLMARHRNANLTP